jgi:hypothetical protein
MKEMKMEYPTYIEARKITDKLKKRDAPQFDDISTEVMQKRALHYGTEFTDR